MTEEFVPLISLDENWNKRDFWEKRLTRYKHTKRKTIYELLAIVPYVSFNGISSADDDILTLVIDDANVALMSSIEFKQNSYNELHHDLLCLDKPDDTQYFEMDEVQLQDNFGEGIEHNDILVIYRCVDTRKLWAREVTEFYDGRFEKI